MEQRPSWEANGCSPSEKYPACYETQMFITILTSDVL
jgi:hypothetical protein